MEGTDLISWMAWTWPTACFFGFILLCLIGMSVWEFAAPGGGARHGQCHQGDKGSRDFGAVRRHGAFSSIYTPGACPTRSSQPCIFIQLAKASNQPVLVVGFGYMPKPCPPCS